MGGKTFLQGEKDTGGKGREELFQVKQHPTGFIGSADDMFFRTEPSVQDNSQLFSGGNFWDGLVFGWTTGRESVSAKWEGAHFWRG